MSEALLVQEAGAAPVAAPASGARQFRQRLRAQRAATAAAVVVLLLILAALAAPLLTALAGQDPNTYHPDLVDSAAAWGAHRTLRRHQRRALARCRTADRPRPLRPRRLRSPRLPRRRRRRHPPAGRHRPRRGTRRGTRQPLGRPGPQQDHRHQRRPAAHGHRPGTPRDRPARLPPARPDRPGHRRNQLGRHVEDRACPGAQPEVARLRRGGQAERTREMERRPARTAALARRARHHVRRAALPRQHHRRGCPVLPRRRHQTAHTVLGADAHRGGHLVPVGPHLSAAALPGSSSPCSP